MWTEWINEAFTALPGTNDALFKNIWEKRRLLFDGRLGIGDIVDFYSARLIASALRRGKRLLVILPDFRPHRPAFLFATALIRYFLDARSLGDRPVQRNGPVLYFGSQIGIREQLRRTSVQGLELDLAKVFSQQDIRRGATGSGGQISTQGLVSENLPHVITIYSPVDPVGILQTHRPRWIAIDCSDAASIAWLQPLVKESTRQGIPVVAWGQNALSECINDFSELGYTFTWPPNSPRILAGELDTLLHSKDPISLEPIVLCGKPIDPFSSSLRKVRQSLVSATQRAANTRHFGRDAVAIHWKYFWSLESLPVPVDFYEAEASRLWGLQSFRKLSSACSHFRNACMQTDTLLYRDLEDAAVLLEEAYRCLEELGCGLWEALLNLCIEDLVSEEVRILVFPNYSKKQIFLFSMLARHNTTEDDLRKMRIYVMSLNELSRLMHSRVALHRKGDDSFCMPDTNTVWHPILVGLPSLSMTPRLLCAFLHPKVDIVLYPHQCCYFMRRQAEWSIRLGGDGTRNIETLKHLSYGVELLNVPASYGRIIMEKPVEINIDSTRKKETTLDGALWQPEDSVVEVTRLFQFEKEGEVEEITLDNLPSASSLLINGQEEEIWCAKVVRVQFDQGWYANFALEDMINVIGNSGLDSRYVRSLRPEDRVLIFHGQQRQNLYDLIISRVHKHPSIELHLAMIRRWQEDLRIAYAQWQAQLGEPSEVRSYGLRDIDGLLRRMQARESKLVSSLTLTYWIKGSVLCPLDPEDLRRVGEILNMRFVQQHYKSISRAASRLRGLHRGLSNRLNRWLQDQVAGAIHGNDDDVIDAELGLTFGDVRNSLLVLRVKEIENVSGPFLRSTLGLVVKEM